MATRTRRKSDFSNQRGHLLVMHILYKGNREFQVSVPCSSAAVDSVIPWNCACLETQENCSGYVVVLQDTADGSLRKRLLSCFQKKCVACVIPNAEGSELTELTVDFEQHCPIFLLNKQSGLQLLRELSNKTEVFIKTVEDSSKLKRRRMRKVQVPSWISRWKEDVDVKFDQGILKECESYLVKLEDEANEQGVINDMSSINKHIMELIPTTFCVLFPVYIFYFSHIVNNQEAYYCEDLHRPIELVVDQFHKLVVSDPKTVIDQIEKTRLSSHSRNTWKALGHSFPIFLKHWMGLYKEIPEDIFAVGIPMNITSHVIMRECGIGKHELQRLWEPNLLQFTDRVSFRQHKSPRNCIQGLRDGLEFQVAIDHLPMECCFTPKHFKNLLNPSGKVFTLFEARNALLAIPYKLKHEWKSSFVSDFVMPLRIAYRDKLRKSKYSDFTELSTQGEWTGMIVEGVGFVIEIDRFIGKSGCKEIFIDKSFKWLRMLVKSVLFEKLKCENELLSIEALFEDKEVVRRHREPITQKMCSQLKMKLKFLSPKQFLMIEKYTREKGITDESIFREYFCVTEIKSHIEDDHDLVCSKSEYSCLIKEWMLRNPNYSESGLNELLDSVHGYYSRDGRPQDFFLDLIQLNIPRLIIDEKSFSNYLRRKLTPVISKAIFSELVEYMGLPVRSSENILQFLVCKVVLEGLQCIEFESMESTCIDEILETAHRHFNVSGSRTLLSNLPSPRMRFICGIMHIFITKIDLKQDSLIFDGPFSILKLLKIMLPLYNLRDEDVPVPNSCQEYFDCLHFFEDVKMKIQSLSKQLYHKLISFDDLSDVMKDSNFQEITDIIDILELRNENIKFEQFNNIFESFAKVRPSISRILVPTFNAESKTLCCSLLHDILKKYEIQLPEELNADLHEAVDMAKLMTVAKTSGSQIITEYYDGLTFSGGKNVVDLEKLLLELKEFLGNLSQKLHIFCFFNHWKSHFFEEFTSRRYHELSVLPSEKLYCTSHLLLACDEALNVIQRTVNGDSTLEELGLGLSDETGEEIALFTFFVKQTTGVTKFKANESFKALCTLTDVCEGMLCVQEVCSLFELEKCSNDLTFQKLSSFAKKLEFPEGITLNEASSMIQEFTCSLPNVKGNFEPFFNLFSELKKSFEYITFLRNKGFVGEEGRRKFSQERNLITQEIQHTLEQRILDDLWDAYSTLSIFLDPKITYESWKSGLQKMSNYVEKSVMQIRVLHQRSISQLEKVFALKESQSKEHTLKILRLLFNYGIAVYSATENSPVTLSVEFRNEDGNVFDKWDLKTLSEVATDAELLLIDEEENENEDEIKLFLQIYENCLGIIDILKKLKDAGHFGFQVIEDCSHKFCRDSTHWKTMLETLKEKCYIWGEKTLQFRNNHKFLSFFTNLKLYQIYQLMKCGYSEVHNIQKKIIFSMMYAQSSSSESNSMMILQTIHDWLAKWNPETDKPMIDKPFSVVGDLLSTIGNNCTPHNLKLNRSHASLNNISNFFRLYLLSESANSKLYNSALNLLSPPLAVSQVMPCTLFTTQEAISLFFQRIKYMSHLRYVLIDVNVLSLDLQEVVIKECMKLLKYGNDYHIEFDVTFIESNPSLMRTMPLCFQDNISVDDSISLTKKFRPCIISFELKLVYGHPGNGKSHFIGCEMKKLNCPILVFAINEDLNIRKCIKELNAVSRVSTECALHLNFTLPFIETYAITKKETQDFQMTCKVVNWFFFNLFLSGYVEDYHSGDSFSSIQLAKMTVFVEVPVLRDSDKETYIEEFNQYFPVFSYIATDVIYVEMKFDADTSDAMLVGKYFKARKNDELDILYKGKKRWLKGNPKADLTRNPDGVRIGNYSDLSTEECYVVLQPLLEKQLKKRKVYQKMLIRYMYRRCKFMEDSYQMRYFEGKIISKDEQGDIVELDGRKLRSSLLYLMESEAYEFCSMESGNGFKPPHIQLIYDGGSFGVLTRGGPASISSKTLEIIHDHGFELPSPSDLKKQSILEEYLCRALGIQRTYHGEIPVLKSKGYVLTLDYLLKMISIHERQQCGMPVIISGETGVGKTFLLETMSSLYNFSQQQRLCWWRSKLLEFIHETLHFTCHSEEEYRSQINSLSGHDRIQHLKVIHSWFLEMQKKHSIMNLFSLIEYLPDRIELKKEFKFETCCTLVLKFLFGKERHLFKVLQVHTGLTPSDIRDFMQALISEEEDLGTVVMNRPKLTVFFDEVNTSSCPGFLKELIIDHSLDGKPLPENVFIVAACNPHRGNSVSTMVNSSCNSQSEQWYKGDYLVHPLHPSFKHFIWDFGFLEPNEEKDYIQFKLKQCDGELTNSECEILKYKIAKSQQLLREITHEYLLESRVCESDSLTASRSVVSQRDIQRVLNLYLWLKKSFQSLHKYGYSNENVKHGNWQIAVRALYISLALVYYFRLNAKYRDKYAKQLDCEPTPVIEISSTCLKGVHITFTKALRDELTWLMENIELPPGVANTKALRENLLSIVVCSMTKIPLIIIGPPGSSKTLSFKIAVANLLGEVSPKQMFRNKVMKYLEPHIYQCSKHSVSEDIDALFEKATLRQKQIDESGQDATVVVFMDEAGLPDEKMQVLKVLHYHLDNPKVPFVALSNSILDAAKSNRAICLFQLDNSHEDLNQLVAVMLGFSSIDLIPVTIQGQISCFTDVYLKKMKAKDFNSLFGLRDIMHFFSYIRRRMNREDDVIPPELILRSLQRNFSGALNFEDVAEEFLSKCGLHLDQIAPQYMMSTLMVLKESLADMSENLSYENEVRYKLLIQHSEDESLIHLLFKFGVLERRTTRLYCLSKLPGDKTQKAAILAKVRNSIVHGHTIVLIQCDEIFESFYDLFNQRFTFIDDYQTKKRNYYARIASGSKSANCLVHPNFQCVVLVKLSEVPVIPAPFMNRFEKYLLSHDCFLAELLNHKHCLVTLLTQAKKKVEDFLSNVPPPGIYGLQDHTLISLIIAHVRFNREGTDNDVDCIRVCPGGESVMIILEEYSSLKALKTEACSANTEFFEDVEYVLSITKEEQCLCTELIKKARFALPEILKEKCVVDKDISSFIYLLTQLLCVRMTKELMQLMPPEVFLAMKEKIPEYYIKSYMKYHFHFSLGDLVKDAIQKSVADTKLSTTASKMLCFSRTTSFVFDNLPHEFFDFDSDISKFEKKESLRIVFPQLTEDDLASLCVFQLYHNSASSEITRTVKKFLLMESYGILLILVNMQETSSDSVNYLRLVIEETEFETKERKQFILLLHFPSENFFIHCYPAYFQDGWNLHYLDAIAPSDNRGAIDLKSCFQYAYYGENNSGLKFVEEVVDYFLATEVSAFCAGCIGTLLLTQSHSISSLASLLSPNRNSIGSALKVKFCKHWSPKKMMQTLQQAANSALSLGYTLNMTDAINTIIKSNFFDFMRYMLSILLKHGALSILINETHSNFFNLICCQIEDIELPMSSTQLKIEVITAENRPCASQFPFFQMIYDTIENVLKSTQIPSVDLSNERIKTLTDQLESQIRKSDIILDTISKMDCDSNLWICYMLQFLSLFYEGVTKDSKLFKYYYDQSNFHDNIFCKLVWLHCSLSLIPHDVISVLRFFDTISANTVDTGQVITYEEKNVLELLSNPSQCAEEVITKFFQTLTIVAENVSGKVQIEFHIDQLVPKYNSVFLSSPLKELIYVNLPADVEILRDGIAVFFTLVHTHVSTDLSLTLLKHFTNKSSRFDKILRYRVEYLVKIPVESIADAPFLLVLSGDDNNIDKEAKKSIRDFVYQIFKLISAYSSDVQKWESIDWICGDVCTNVILQRVPIQTCTESECLSSLCFLEKFFNIAATCDKLYLTKKVEDLFLKSKKPLTYIPYYLRNLQTVVANNDIILSCEPLKTLLFLTEFRLGKKGINGIGNLISLYQQCKDSKDDPWMCLKKHAVVSLITEETAENIVKRSDTLINDVDNILNDDLPELNGLLLVFHIFRRCKSFKLLRKLLLQENELCRDFSCLTNLRQLYNQQKGQVFPEQSSSSLFEYIPNKTILNTAKRIFLRVSLAVKELVDSSKNDVPRSLIAIIASSCLESDYNKMHQTKPLSIMCLFLSLYHEIYMEEIQSVEIAQLLKQRVGTFINPLCSHVMEVFVRGGSFELSSSLGVNKALTSFLNPQAQTDDIKDMWKCVANLIAFILGTSGRSSNFSMHLFQPSALSGTFIPGATTKGPVGEVKYKDAMLLSESGFCDSYQSYMHVTRGKASLPCLYFLQWANYACLCVYLLGLNSVERGSPSFNGELFDDPSSAFLVCLESMEKLWSLILKNLGITAEQRVILVDYCIGKLVKVVLDGTLDLAPAWFDTQKDVDNYESSINSEIFIPAWNDMLLLSEGYQNSAQKGSLDYEIIHLEKRYPVFADQQSFLMLVMTSTNLNDTSSPYYALYQFLLKRPVLDCILRNLPEIADFYQWIHNQFPHCITKEETELVTIRQLLESKLHDDVGYTSDIRDFRKEQFSRLCAFTKELKEKFIFAPELPALRDNMLLSEIICIPGASGLILNWIERLIKGHNLFLKDVSQTTYGANNYWLQRIQKEFNEVSVSDIENKFSKESVTRFDNIGELMPLIENCCCLSPLCYTNTYNNDESLLKNVVPQVYHLEQLQDEVVSLVLSKMRYIKSLASTSIRFPFKNVEESVTSIFVDSAAVSLDDLESTVPAEYKVKPDSRYHAQALRYCHSLNYHSLMEITIGLRIATVYIIQVHNSKEICADLIERIQTTSLPDFLIECTKLPEKKDALASIGVDISRLNQLQFRFLDDLQMKDIMKALHTFVMWLQDGIYDFSSLPVVLKETLGTHYDQHLSKIRELAFRKGEEHKLLENIHLINHSLARCEKIVRKVAESSTAANMSLKKLLLKHFKIDEAYESFPDVPVCQYVRYRLALRKMQNDIQKKIQEQSPCSCAIKVTWNDTINKQQLLVDLEVDCHELPTSSSQQDLCDLNSEQISELMRLNNLDDEYARCAYDNEVDGDLILTLKDKPLRGLLGMKKDPIAFLQFKFVIMRKFKDRKQNQLAVDFPPQRVAEIFDQFHALKSAVPFILKHHVDGEMLSEADIDVLKQISTDHQAAENFIKNLLKLK